MSVAINRPLWLEFPRDKNTYNIEDQVMIGEDYNVRSYSLLL